MRRRAMDDKVSNEPGLVGLAYAIRSGGTDEHLKSLRQNLDEDGWNRFADAAVAAHERGGEIDLVNLLKGGQGTRVGFATQQLVERAVPTCTPGLEDLLTLLSDAVVREDGKTPYWMLSGVSRWCEISADNAQAALEAVRDGRAPTDLTHSAVAAGLKIDRSKFMPIAVAMLGGTNTIEQDVAGTLLGRIEDFSAVDQTTAVAALETALRTADGELVSVPLRSLLAIAIRDPAATPIGLAALDEVRPRSDRHVREAIAMELMFGAAKADPALTRSALSLLHDTGADEIATVESIDHFLSGNVAGPLTDDVATLADNLIGNGATTMKRLNSYEHHLLADGTGALTRSVTRWLLADSLPLYEAVRDVCQSVHDKPLTFDLDFSSAGLTPERAVRIARRACGVLLISPEAAASIIASMMRTGPAEAIPALAATLWDPLLISYWEGPRAYLEAVLPSLPQLAADAVKEVLAKLDRYSADVEKARDLPELRPSQQHRHLAAIKRHQEQLAIEKIARERSVFASLFPSSIMMFGDSAIYDVVTEPGKSIRQETKLGTHEYSHELPRLDVIDPFGTWYQRAHMIKDGDA